MFKILIVGGGLAAISAAEEITKTNDGTLEVSLISRSESLFIYPALVPYVFGKLERRDLTVDFGPKLAEKNVRFYSGEVSSIDTASRTVRYVGPDGEQPLSYDLLLIALGRRLEADAVPGFTEHADHLLDLAAADKLRKDIGRFDSGQIVVGLCPGSNLPIPVCEAALAFADRYSPKIRAGRVSVTAVFPETLDDAFFGAALFRDLVEEFERKGVSVLHHFRIKKVGPSSVYADDGRTVPYSLVMLVPPLKGQTSLPGVGRFSDTSGFLNVDEHLSVRDADGVYAAGDIISIPGPRFGYMAIRQGKIAGENLVLQAHGKEPSSVYEHSIAWAIGEKYTDPVFFHYGFWDESLEDFDEDALFGLLKSVRQKYGPIKGFGRSLASPG